jgi:predicted MPP superfamily phosphohydrolase
MSNKSRLKGLFIFLSIFGLILFAANYYIFSRLNYYLQLTQSQQHVIIFLMTALTLIVLLMLPLSRVLPRIAASILAWITFPWMGIVLLSFITLFATDIIWLLLEISTINQSPKSWEISQHSFGVVALCIIAFLIIFSFWKGLKGVAVKRVNIELKCLPKSLDGLRIVQLTDVHIGPLLGRKWLQKIVNKVNKLQPDLIVITGDLVDGSVDELREHIAPLENLRAKHGVYFVTGNHEYYSGATEWCAHIATFGIRVLRNECLAITAGAAHESFDLAGVDDWSSSRFPGEGHNLSKALLNHDPKKLLILLAHQPTAVEEAAQRGVDLQLSGHTHGGQIWPFTYLVYLQQPFSKGLHRYKDSETQIYISTGTGFWGPPMRLGTSAEIAHITLRSV